MFAVRLFQPSPLSPPHGPPNMQAEGYPAGFEDLEGVASLRFPLYASVFPADRDIDAALRT